MASEKYVNQKYEVTPLELIFDLVIVFACSELTKHLLLHFSIIGLVQIMILLIAVYNLWTYTSFGATLIHNGVISTRWLVMVVMLLGIFLNVGIEEAFELQPWLFIVPYLASQLGQGFFTMLFARNKGLRHHYLILTIWNLITAPIWVIGAFAQDEMRIVYWGIAALIDLVGLLFAHPAPKQRRSTENVQFDAEHMLERCRLFLIIALGEAVFTLIEALIESPMNAMTILLGIASFITIISMWALYFWGSDHLVVKHVEATRNAIRTAHLTMNSLFVTVTGLVLFSVGTRLIIGNPYGYPSPLLNSIFFGGPILYIAAQSWYMWYVLGQVPRVRIMTSIVLLILALANLQWHAYALLLFAMASMVLLTAIVIHMNKTSD